MEKGKGKSKNKGKEQKGGRGGGWDAGAWGFGRGRGKGNSKEKERTKERRAKARLKLDPISVPFALDMDTGQESVQEEWKSIKFNKPRLNPISNSLDLLNLSSMHLTLAKLFNLLDPQAINFHLLDLLQPVQVQDHHLRALLVQQ